MKTLHIYPTGVGYHITVTVVVAFLFGLSVSNSAYFSKISETPNVSVSRSTLRGLSSINVFVSIVSGLLVLWSLYRVVSSHESKHKTMHEEYMNSLNEHMNEQHHHHHYHKNVKKEKRINLETKPNPDPFMKHHKVANKSTPKDPKLPGVF